MLSTVRSKQKTDLPFERDVKKLVMLVTPVVERVLKLPGPDSTCLVPGTKLWCEKRIGENNYSLRECCDHPAIMDAYVTRSICNAINEGDTRGYPALKKDELIPSPDSLYVLNKTRLNRKRAKVYRCYIVVAVTECAYIAVTLSWLLQSVHISLLHCHSCYIVMAVTLSWLLNCNGCYIVVSRIAVTLS